MGTCSPTAPDGVAQGTSVAPSSRSSSLGRYQLCRQLGSGQYGDVWLAIDKWSNDFVAIKTLLKRTLHVEYVKREIRNHQDLCHLHIVKFKRAFVTLSHLCIVMEYGGSTNLYDLLRKSYAHGLSEDKARRIFQQLIRAVDYCHRKVGMEQNKIPAEEIHLPLTNLELHVNIVIGDIKPKNLILSEPQWKGWLKLCDFGFSMRDERTSHIVGTIAYLAPEVIAKNGTYDAKKADAWACGVTLYELLTGPRCDYHDRKKTEVLARLNGLTNECHDCLFGLLDPYPQKRLSVNDVMKHAWFKNTRT